MTEHPSRDHVAHAEIVVAADRERVWRALTDPEALRKLYFGAEVESGWRPGDPISWRGEWQGRRYEDKGEVLEAVRGERLRFTHYSPLSGLPDTPESYHRVQIDLRAEGEGTRVVLAQGGNATDEARRHSEENWRQLLDSLRRLLEG